MRGLLHIEGSDGSLTRAPCRARFSAPSVNVELDQPVELASGVSYRMTLAREDGSPVEPLAALHIQQPLIRPVQLSAAELLFDGQPHDRALPIEENPELVELKTVRVLHTTNFGLLCEVPGQSEEVFIPANHVFGVNLEDLRPDGDVRFSVPAWFAREHRLI